MEHTYGACQTRARSKRSRAVRWIRSSLRSLRQVARQRHPMHDPAESVVIVDGVVLGAAIVPEGEGARLPAETAGELGTDLMREQVFEKRLALLNCPALEMGGMGGVDVERLPARLGVRADHGVGSDEHLQLHPCLAQTVLARARNLRLGGGIDAHQTSERLLQSLGESFIGQI